MTELRALVNVADGMSSLVAGTGHVRGRGTKGQIGSPSGGGRGQTTKVYSFCGKTST